MAWNSPVTFVAGQALSAFLLNTYIRDNLNETEAAKAAIPPGSVAASIFASTGANAIAERGITPITMVLTSETRSNSSYGDLATVGPAATLTTGTQAFVAIAANMRMNGTGVSAYASFAVSGATTIAASDNRSILHREAGAASGRSARLGACHLVTGLTAGSNTFTMKYRNEILVAEIATYFDRRMLVVAL